MQEGIDIKTIFTKKETCYFAMIDKFFKRCPDNMITKMINIIDGNDKISLRILDWFVTRYSKKGIDFAKDNGDVFDVHINYKAQLKSYKKRYFDPFRRKNKFNYEFNIGGEKKLLLTTIGQLNFFGWAINNNIISFVDQSLQQITKAMNVSNREDKKKKVEKAKIKKNNDDDDANSDYSTDDDSYSDDENDSCSDDVSDKSVNVIKKIELKPEVKKPIIVNIKPVEEINKIIKIKPEIKPNIDLTNLTNLTKQEIKKPDIKQITEIIKPKPEIIPVVKPIIPPVSEQSNNTKSVNTSNKINKTKSLYDKKNSIVVKGTKKYEVDEIELTLSFD